MYNETHVSDAMLHWGLTKMGLAVCVLPLQLCYLLKCLSSHWAATKVHLFFADLLFHRFHNNCISGPVLFIFLSLKQNKTQCILSLSQNIMWDVFLAAWAERRQKRQKEREKEKERRTEDWNKRRTVWGGYDEFWFQRAHPPVALPQRLSSGWRWVMCDGFLFSRAQRAADLSKAAAEYILQRRHRKRSSSGFHPLCASSKGRFRASRKASRM